MTIAVTATAGALSTIVVCKAHGCVWTLKADAIRRLIGGKQCKAQGWCSCRNAGAVPHGVIGKQSRTTIRSTFSDGLASRRIGLLLLRRRGGRLRDLARAAGPLLLGAAHRVQWASGGRMRRRADDGVHAESRTALVARPLAATGRWRPNGARWRQNGARRRDAAAVGLRRATHPRQRDWAAVGPPLRRGAGDRGISAGEARATAQQRFAGRAHGAPGWGLRAISRRRLLIVRRIDRA